MTRPISPAVRALLTPAVIRRTTSTLLEVIAIALIAVLVATVTSPVWALIPIALYLLVIAVSLSRPRGGQ